MTTINQLPPVAPPPAPPTNTPFTHGYGDGVAGRAYNAAGYHVADQWLYLGGWETGNADRNAGVIPAPADRGLFGRRGKHRFRKAVTTGLFAALLLMLGSGTSWGATVHTQPASTATVTATAVTGCKTVTYTVRNPSHVKVELTVEDIPGTVPLATPTVFWASPGATTYRFTLLPAARSGGPDTVSLFAGSLQSTFIRSDQVTWDCATNTSPGPTGATTSRTSGPAPTTYPQPTPSKPCATPTPTETTSSSTVVSTSPAPPSTSASSKVLPPEASTSSPAPVTPASVSKTILSSPLAPELAPQPSADTGIGVALALTGDDIGRQIAVVFVCLIGGVWLLVLAAGRKKRNAR